MPALMTDIRALVLALLALVAWPAHSFELKGLTVGSTIDEIRQVLPGLDCDATVQDGLQICAWKAQTDSRYATYAQRSVATWGFHHANGRVVSVLIFFASNHDSGLRASMTGKFGPGTETASTQQALAWEADGQRLSLGVNGVGASAVSLWDLEAFNAMVQARMSAQDGDM